MPRVLGLPKLVSMQKFDLARRQQVVNCLSHFKCEIVEDDKGLASDQAGCQ